MATALNLTDLTRLTSANDSSSLETTEVKGCQNNENGPSWSIPSLPHNKDFHLFVCYIQDNSSEVREIVETLEREGIRCCYHERDFLPGQQVIGNINDAINRSMCTLVVLSEQFVQSRFCLHEVEQALHARISQGYTIIPIKIEPCDIPESLKYITYIDAETIPPNEMYVKILDAFIWNDWQREQNVESNGFMRTFPLTKYTMGFRWLSMYRFKLEFDEEAKQNLQRYNFQITDEVLKELQTTISDSVHVKYAHIFRSFSWLTTLLFVMEILLFSGVVILILEYTLGSTMNENNISVFPLCFSFNIMAMFFLWIIFLIVHLCGVHGNFKSWKGFTHGLEERESSETGLVEQSKQNVCRVTQTDCMLRKSAQNRIGILLPVVSCLFNSKLVWVYYRRQNVTLPAVTNLYGDEADKFFYYLDREWVSLTESICIPSCPEPFKETRETRCVITNTSEAFSSLQDLVDKWMADTETCNISCEDDGIRVCTGVRNCKRKIKKFSPILIIRLYEHCLHNRISTSEVMASEAVKIEDRSYKLAGITMHRELHYCAVILYMHTFYWYDGLRGRLQDIPNDLENWFPCHAVYCQQR